MNTRRCETCRFWLGKPHEFRADCVNPTLYASRPAFDEGATCSGWQGKAEAVQAGKVATMPGNWAQALMKGKNQP